MFGCKVIDATITVIDETDHKNLNACFPVWAAEGGSMGLTGIGLKKSGGNENPK
jgi:hypothetical protein